MTLNLLQEALEVTDALEAQELFCRNGWTDSLPVVPPTAKKI